MEGLCQVNTVIPLITGLPLEILWLVLGLDQGKVLLSFDQWIFECSKSETLRQVTMITILVITALLGSAVISRIESCNIGGFQYIPPPPPPCEPCQPDSSGKLARIFFNNRCCELTTTITKGI